MKTTCGIYKITSPTKKVYIGQSVAIEKRFIRYRGLHCKEQAKIYRSLLKYGVNAHKFEILCECKEEELNELEVYYIELYQSFNSEFGLNLQSGGGSKCRASDETKQKMKIARKNIVFSQETKDKIRKGKLGKKLVKTVG